MATNLFLKTNNPKDIDGLMHIGRSSYDRCFALHVYPERGIHTLDDWIRKFKDGHIVKDMGSDDPVPPDDLVAHITEWQAVQPPDLESESVRDYMEFHQLEPGPNNLLRQKIGSICHGYCIGHGDGPWDYLIGEFDTKRRSWLEWTGPRGNFDRPVIYRFEAGKKPSVRNL